MNIKDFMRKRKAEKISSVNDGDLKVEAVTSAEADSKEEKLKEEVQNLIVLDKSGSMTTIRKEAITGVNECLMSIRRMQERTPEQRQYVTLIVFCGCGCTKLFDAVPVEETRPLTDDDYDPCCCTPLYDAIGTGVMSIDKLVKDKPMASVSVTIITDGYENASREFNHNAITTLIKERKEKGWLFAYIGADHDVESVAISLSIDNHLKFDKTESGTKAMFSARMKAQERWSESMHEARFAVKKACAGGGCPTPEMMEDMQKEIRRKNLHYFDSNDDEE